MKDIWVLKNNKHAWAFYYFLKRQGDDVRIVNYGSIVEILVK